MEAARIEPILPSRDLDETRQFYGTLGFSAKWNGRTHHDYEIVSRGEIVVHFYLQPDLDPCKNEHMCYWRVDDADRLHGELAKLQLPLDGIPRLTPPADQAWGMREFAIVDPAGNLIRVGHELRR